MDAHFAGPDLGIQLVGHAADDGVDLGQLALVVAGQAHPLTGAQEMDARLGHMEDQGQAMRIDQLDQRHVRLQLAADHERLVDHLLVIEVGLARMRAEDRHRVGRRLAGLDRIRDVAQVPAHKALLDGGCQVGIAGADRGCQLTLRLVGLRAVEIDDRIAQKHLLAAAEGRIVALDDAPTDAADHDLGEALVVFGGAIGADHDAGRTRRHRCRPGAHAALLLTRELAGRHPFHLHAAHRAVARFAADEIHHRTGPALVGGGFGVTPLMRHEKTPRRDDDDQNRADGETGRGAHPAIPR